MMITSLLFIAATVLFYSYSTTHPTDRRFDMFMRSVVFGILFGCSIGFAGALVTYVLS